MNKKLMGAAVIAGALMATGVRAPAQSKDRPAKVDRSMEFNRLLRQDSGDITRRCRVLLGKASDGASLAIGFSKSGQPVFVDFQCPNESARLKEFLLLEDQRLSGSAAVDLNSNFEFALPVTPAFPMPPKWGPRVSQWDPAIITWYLVGITTNADKTISCKITKTQPSPDKPVSMFVLKEWGNSPPGETTTSLVVTNGSFSTPGGAGPAKLADSYEFTMHWEEPAK